MDVSKSTRIDNNSNNNDNQDAVSPPFVSITEGSITMKYPADEESTVFYNPVQVQNRDLSILMLCLYSERRAVRAAVQTKRNQLRASNQGKSNDDPNRMTGEQIAQALRDYEATLDPSQVVVTGTATTTNTAAAAAAGGGGGGGGEARFNGDEGKKIVCSTNGMSILDALAASGLRSMRYWKEVPNIKHVTINDLDPAAVERAHWNIQSNELSNVLLSNNSSNDNNNNDSDNNDGKLPWQRPHGIRVQNGDAKIEMYLSQRPQALTTLTNPTVQNKLHPQWDVIDLDPYGSAAPFLDAAVQAIEHGGMLNVTCTDMAALGGSHPETCYGRYASMPIPNARYLQEVALRILLGNIATTAAKYGRTIKPILSVGMNFYIRVFVEVYNDKAGVSKLSLQMGSVFQSTQCASFHLVKHGRLGGRKDNVFQPERAPPVPTCEEIGGDFKVGGPMWLGPLHDREVVQTALDRLQGKYKHDDSNNNYNSNAATSSSLPSEDHEPPSHKVYPDMKWIATRARLEGLLLSVKDELPDVPLYYGMPDFCRTLKCSSPPLHVVQAALINGGYRVSGYHKDPQAIKTDAPSRFMWDILRTWIKLNPLQKEPQPDSLAAKILAVEPTSKIDFTISASLKNQMAANSQSKVSRFPMNPEANWGPKKAASGKKRSIEANDADATKRSK